MNISLDSNLQGAQKWYSENRAALTTGAHHLHDQGCDDGDELRAWDRLVQIAHHSTQRKPAVAPAA
ncbi:hypothetical protein [Nonomuraea sp. NPDC049695]|uniref:hypothetical protein n=1 Tax=Nonomuraea sp. NPDC049695 TaxID=3154734 RepID=UPI00343737F3